MNLNCRSRRTSIPRKRRGNHKQTSKQWRLYINLSCYEAIYTSCGNVPRSMQQTNSTARGTLQCIQVLRPELQKFGEESFMSNILSKIDAYVTDNVLEPLPRSRSNRAPVDWRETLVPESLTLQKNVE